MIIGLPRELRPGERRTALVPAHVSTLTGKSLGAEVLVEPGAGLGAGHSDADYVAAGARIATDRAALFAEADVLATVHVPFANGGDAIRSGQRIVGYADPLGPPEAMAALGTTGARVHAMELVPRITRAQSMDALSAMATISGYKAVLVAANELPKIFPMLMTAAGTISAAKVLVLGAGVAGLQAIATARRLGAVVSGYDVRAAAKEQVLSLGARFVEAVVSSEAEGAGGYAKELGADVVRKQQEALAKAVADSDAVVTTAAVPGARSPVLVTAEMVKAMRPGSVIVDLAAERGGNCELTVADEKIVAYGVTIFGPTNLPASVPGHASQMYSKTMVNLLVHLAKAGALKWPPDVTEDPIVNETLVTSGGAVVHPKVLERLGLGA